MLHTRLLSVVREKVAEPISPELLKLLGVGAAGLGVGAVGSHLITKNQDEEQLRRTRNRSFGAGVATGVATPHMVRGLYNIAQRNGFIPEGMGQ